MGATRAPNAMHVVLRAARKIEVDDQLDVGDVETTRRDVRRDHHREPTAPERGERALAVRLREETREADDLVAAAAKERSDLARCLTRRGEDQRLLVAIRLEQEAERLLLVARVDLVELVVDPVREHRVRLDPHGLRVVHEAFGELGDRRRHRRGEQHGLTRERHARADLHHVVDEAHVEHAVRFVEDEPAHMARPDPGGAQEVDQTTGRADDDVRLLVELVLLRAETRAAVDGRRAHAEGLADALRDLAHLLSEFTRRADDQRLDLAVRFEGVEDRNEEGQRLAGARLGNADDVPSVESNGYAALLDRRRRNEAAVGEDAMQFGGQW